MIPSRLGSCICHLPCPRLLATARLHGELERTGPLSEAMLRYEHDHATFHSTLFSQHLSKDLASIPLNYQVQLRLLRGVTDAFDSFKKISKQAH